MSALSLVPNGLTLLRVVMVPWIIPAILRQEFPHALLLCWIAGLTDAADGFSARLLKVSSAAGAYLDPIADKILLSAIYICLGIVHIVPVWLVILIFARDVVILAGVSILMIRTGSRRFPPSRWGKLSTIFQILTALIALSAPAFQSPFLFSMLQWLIVITTVTTGGSGAHYAVRGWRMWHGGTAD